MIWLLLCFGICVEVAGTFFLKKAEGFENLQFVGLMLVCYLTSMATMSTVAKTLPLTTVYPIWTGVGTLLVTTVGFVIFKEALPPSKIVFIGLIVIGVVGIYRS